MEIINENIIAFILSSAKRGIRKSEIMDNAGKFKATTKIMNFHIKESKKRGLYSIPEMNTLYADTYYQYNGE